MAMVKISNGEVTQVVSRGAFDTQYKNLGFEIVAENKAKKPEKKSAEPEKADNIPVEDAVDTDVEEEVIEDAEDFDELLEKPLSQWTNEELKAFVNAKGIDTSSAKKTSEVRSLVKKYLDEEAKGAAEV